jgi:hypothetical protein
MAIKGRVEGFKGILGIMFLAAALTGCGGSEGDSAANASTSATSILASGNALGPTMNSGMGTIALSEAAYQAIAASSAVVTVYRTGTGRGSASADYQTIDGTARAGTDYGATSGSLTWNDGDLSSRTVIIPVGASAAGKEFAIALANVGGRAKLGNPARATIQVSSGTTGGSASGSSSSSSGSSSSGSSSSGSSSGGSSSGGSSPSSSGSGSGSSGGGSSSSSGVSTGSSSSGGSSSSSGATAGTKSATLSWAAPTENTDGTALTNLAGYNIYYGNNTGAMTNKISINTTGIQTYVIDNLASGSWYFTVTALNSAGTESVAASTVGVTL